MMEELTSALEKFGIADVFSCRKIGNGHINDTFLVKTAEKKFTFQRINTSVFRDVDRLMDNVVRVTDHIAKKAFTVRPLPAADGKFYVRRNDGAYRLMTYAEGEIRENISSSDDMETVGKGFGRFQLFLSDFDGLLYDTIPNFHNTPIRYVNFLRSASKETERREKANKLIEEYVLLKNLSAVVTDPLYRGKIPLRVVHNDTKINNLVIKDGEPVCAIDLDTVMNGSLLYDFGDAVRSGGTVCAEDGDPSTAKLDIELFESFCKGFLTCGLQITENERKLLPVSPALLSYECGMRFLTDYLDGDVYFGAAYPEQNLVRAANQLALAKDILKKTEEVTKIVDGFFN